VPGAWRGGARDRGVLFHVGRLWYGLRLVASAVLEPADVVVAAGGTQWFLLGLLPLLGVKVVPSLHCALWPTGRRPKDLWGRVQQFLDGFFWRRGAAATICVSPECERQVREIAGAVRGPIVQARAHYRREYLDKVCAPPAHGERPFRVLMAGRVERLKGMFDLLSVAERLERERPGQFAWEVCGSGGALDELREAVRQKGIEKSFTLMGHLERAEMARALGRAHAVVVPTKSGFAEGLNKSAVEAVLAGRPVVTSRLSNVLELLGPAVVEVPPDDVTAYGDAIIRLSQDVRFYEEKLRACAAVQGQFYDPERSWQAALRRALAIVLRGRVDACGRPVCPASMNAEA